MTRLAAGTVALAVGLGLALAGCTDEPAEPAEPETPAASSTSSTTTTSDPTAAPETPFDCAAVSAAQQELNEASEEQLSRLGIDRDDPRAFSVVVLVASQQAAEFWQDVEAAATPALDEAQRADVRLVAGYWTAIDTELDAIEVVDSSDAAVQAASDELARVSSNHPQDDLAAAQQRIQDVLAATCGTEPAESPSP